MERILFLLLALTGTCLCQDRRPTISFITQPEIVTDIGGTVEMKCSVQYGQDYPVIWMKLDPVDRNNDLPITTGTTLILHDPRFHIDLDKVNEIIQAFLDLQFGLVRTVFFLLREIQSSPQ